MDEVQHSRFIDDKSETMKQTKNCKRHQGRTGPQAVAAKRQSYDDFRIKHELELEEYKVIRIWEHDIIKEDFDIQRFLKV